MKWGWTNCWWTNCLNDESSDDNGLESDSESEFSEENLKKTLF